MRTAWWTGISTEPPPEVVAAGPGVPPGSVRAEPTPELTPELLSEEERRPRRTAVMMRAMATRMPTIALAIRQGFVGLWRGDLDLRGSGLVVGGGGEEESFDACRRGDLGGGGGLKGLGSGDLTASMVGRGGGQGFEWLGRRDLGGGD